ncbi:ABC transporter substrate-binding protein [Puniceicoccaceae bacterium K14]|nr:ABC transporter substrate-binding protein [Puniceicoccaceae bacterium K14]
MLNAKQLAPTAFSFWLLVATCLGSEIIPNQYANNFSIERFEEHTIITVSNLWRGSGNTQYQYALVPKSFELPTNLPKNAMIIRTPVERIVTMATIYLGHIQELDTHDLLIGTSYLSHTNDPIVRKRVADGLTKSIKSGSSVDVESLMLMKPDIILTSTTGTPAFDVHPQLLRANLPVVLTAGYMENHPLARSEWIRFLAEFVDMDEQADQLFQQTASEYEALAKLTQSVSERPTLFANAPYGGNWHLPGGNSYTAKAFEDAGANYLWSDDQSSGGIPLDFERVYFKAANAEFWFNPSSNRSLKMLLQTDERFVKFKAFRDGHVFNNTKRMNSEGGNDIWERGISHPEEVLADLIKILHPDLLPDHELIFYEQLR